jgi:hypothetical protein
MMFVNIISPTCKDCMYDGSDTWFSCVTCGSLSCGDHDFDNSVSCLLCKDIPKDYIICAICDCVKIDRGISDLDMTFSASIVDPEVRMYICSYCFDTFVDKKDYQTNRQLAEIRDAWENSPPPEGHIFIIRIPSYAPFKAGNDKNYEIIRSARETITKCNVAHLSVYFISDIINIILEYCAFARYIVIEGFNV